MPANRKSTSTGRTTQPAARATGVRASRAPARQTLTGNGSKQIGFIYPIDHVHVLEDEARRLGVSTGALVREFVDAGLGL